MKQMCVTVQSIAWIKHDRSRVQLSINTQTHINHSRSGAEVSPYREPVSKQVLSAAKHLEVYLHLPVFTVARLQTHRTEDSVKSAQVQRI